MPQPYDARHVKSIASAAAWQSDDVVSRSLSKRFAQLSWGNRLLLVEAGLAVSAISMLLLVLPFRRAIRLGSVRRGGDLSDPASVRAVCWSVAGIAHRVPWRAVCLQQGLVAQAMLRRRGFDAVLHYGVRKKDDRLSAHVWVSVAGEHVIGGEAAADFAEVARFPEQVRLRDG